jgi:hypothetical protein
MYKRLITWCDDDVPVGDMWWSDCIPADDCEYPSWYLPLNRT